jgi:hypothetical protein
MSVILPGEWARLPLDDEAADNEEISRIIRRQVPRRDELASMRRDTRQMMRGIAQSARAADAVFLALSLELLPGVPFSAALMARYAPVEPVVGAQVPLPLEVLLATTRPDGEVLELDCGLAARSWRREEPAADDPVSVPSIHLSYVLPTPIEGSWLEWTASVPSGDVEPELIVALFDAIVGTVRWNEPMGSAPHSGSADADLA